MYVPARPVPSAYEMEWWMSQMDRSPASPGRRCRFPIMQQREREVGTCILFVTIFSFLDHKIHLTIFLFVTIFSFRLESDDLPFRNAIRPVLQIKSSARAMMGFANDAFVGM